MQAVILAGGLGTRLRPLTHEIPKVLVPVCERPFLHYILDMLSENSITDIVLCVGHLQDQVVESVSDGDRFGCNIKYSIEKELLDTGGAIKNAEELLDEEFLVLNGDTFHPIDYRALLEFWNKRKENYDGLIVLYENRELIVPNNIRVDEQGNVVEYSCEGFDGNCHVDSGVQIFKKSVFRDIPSGTRVSLEKNIYSKVIEHERMLSYVSSIRYYDIGTSERIQLFEEYLKSRQEA